MKRSLTIIFSLCLLSLPVCVLGQTPAPAPAANTTDTVFTEIQLTSEGVDAVDTAGHPWTYDFDRNTFIPDKSATARTGRGPEGRRTSETTHAPVEQRCTQLKVVEPFSKSVTVGYDEYVPGDIISYGRVIVKGWVKGDIQSISGRVLVTGSGQVDGNVKAPEIAVNEGGKITGTQTITNAIDLTGQFLSKSFSVDGLVIVLGFLLFLLLVGFLATTLFPRQFATMRDCLMTFRARSIFVGLLFVFLLPLIVVLMIITIIGIVIVPFVPLAYVLAMAVGVAAVGATIGNFVSGKILGGSKSVVIHALVGTPIFMLLWVVVAVLLGSSGVAFGFGIFFMIISIIISAYPILGGVGAAVLTRFGFREHKGVFETRRGKVSDAPAPAPPPIPDMPRFVAPPPPIPPNPPRPTEPPDKFGPYGPNPRPPLSSNG